MWKFQKFFHHNFSTQISSNYPFLQVNYIVNWFHEKFFKWERISWFSTLCNSVPFKKQMPPIFIRTLTLFGTRCTMLQKLSKCEVKAWLCLNLIILPGSRFYVKSNYGKIKRSKNVICGNFRDSDLLILVNLALKKCSNLPKIKIQNL